MTAEPAIGREVFAAGRAGARDTLGFAAAAALMGVLFAAAATAKALPAGQIVAMSGVIYAGAAQFAALERWQAPLPLASLALGTGLICARHLLMGLALAPTLSVLRWPARALAAMVITDVSWTLSEARGQPAARWAYFVGSGAAMFVGWLSGTVLGLLAPVHGSFAFGYAGVLFLSLLVVLAAKRRANARAPMLTAALAALLAQPWLGADGGLWAGIAAGAGVALWRLRRDAA